MHILSIAHSVCTHTLHSWCGTAAGELPLPDLDFAPSILKVQSLWLPVTLDRSLLKIIRSTPPNTLEISSCVLTATRARFFIGGNAWIDMHFQMYY